MSVAPKRVLNIGGGQSRDLPERYAGWELSVLDIDPDCGPDICMDAKMMHTLAAAEYDAVLCSHNLEHFYRHEVGQVLKGMLHVLRDDGFAEIIVPHIAGMLEAMRKNNLDLGDVWYRTGDGNAITFHDVLYGWGRVMAEGNLYYAHKCGFTRHTLGAALLEAGFAGANIWNDEYNLYARAYKRAQPCQSQ